MPWHTLYLTSLTDFLIPNLMLFHGMPDSFPCPQDVLGALPSLCPDHPQSSTAQFFLKARNYLLSSWTTWRLHWQTSLNLLFPFWYNLCPREQSVSFRELPHCLGTLTPGQQQWRLLHRKQHISILSFFQRRNWLLWRRNSEICWLSKGLHSGTGQVQHCPPGVIPVLCCAHRGCFATPAQWNHCSTINAMPKMTLLCSHSLPCHA